MRTQLIFCVEADRRSGTDWVYIQSVLNHCFEITNSVSIKPIFMGGKGNYRQQKVIRRIESRTKEFGANREDGATIVIFCIDTDDIQKDPDRLREFETIRAYCDENGFEFVWFCRDIEEVFWQKKVPKSEKLKYAAQFRRDARIADVDMVKLGASECTPRRSNIIEVMSKYLNRRKV